MAFVEKIKEHKHTGATKGRTARRIIVPSLWSLQDTLPSLPPGTTNQSEFSDFFCNDPVINTHPSTPVQARGILQRPEEQSRTGSCQGSSVAGQPQCPRLWHSSTPTARSLSHSPSAPPPSFTQSPYPPRSLVRDGQTHPHRPRLVVSHSTCPPLSSPPHANSFVIGPAVIKHTHRTPHSAVPVCAALDLLATVSVGARPRRERQRRAKWKPRVSERSLLTIK